MRIDRSNKANHCGRLKTKFSQTCSMKSMSSTWENLKNTTGTERVKPFFFSLNSAFYIIFFSIIPSSALVLTMHDSFSSHNVLFFCFPSR